MVVQGVPGQTWAMTGQNVTQQPEETMTASLIRLQGTPGLLGAEVQGAYVAVAWQRARRRSLGRAWLGVTDSS